MCYWTSHFYKSCSHQPLILQNFCHKVTVTDGHNLKYTLGFKTTSPGKSPKGKASPKRLIKPHKSGVNNTVEQTISEPIRMAKLCSHFDIVGNCEIDDVCPDCREEELPTKQKQQAMAGLLQLEKILEEHGITWDMVVDSLDMETSTRSDHFAPLPYPILRYGEVGMLPIAMPGAGMELETALRQFPISRELIDHHAHHGRGLTGGLQLPPTFVDIAQHHPHSSNQAFGNLGNAGFPRDRVFSPPMLAFPPSHPTPISLPHVFPETSQPQHRYSGIFSPPSSSPRKLSLAVKDTQDQHFLNHKQPNKLHHGHKRSQSNIYHPGRFFNEVKPTELPRLNRRSQGSSSYQAISRIPSQPITQPQQEPQQKHQAPTPFTPTSSNVRNRSATVSSNGPPTSAPLSPQAQSTPPTPKTPSMPRLYSSGVVISPPGQRRQVELEFARARNREAARQRERERELEIEAEAKKKKEAEQADQAEMQLRVEREMQALERYRSTGMYNLSAGGSDSINPEGWIDVSKLGVSGFDEDHDERRKLAQTAWERAIGWHR